MKEYKAIKVSPELHQKFKVLAAAEGKDMIEMLEFLIEHWETSFNSGLLRVYSEIKKSKGEK